MRLRARGVAAWLALPLAACSGDTMLTGDTKTMTALPIAPYAIHEECMLMAAGDRLDFRFEASAPVAFDIRYRDGIAIISTVSREDVRELAGVFASPLARRNCAHWEAGPEGAMVDYRLRLLGKGAPS
ncbi:MAG: hypothetical protein ABI777_06485 [Betaproteobacteria bacterium]